MLQEGPAHIYQVNLQIYPHGLYPGNLLHFFWKLRQMFFFSRASPRVRHTCNFSDHDIFSELTFLENWYKVLAGILLENRL